MSTEQNRTVDLCAFCEALLTLEWPGRRVVVTPAPLADALVDVLPNEIIEAVDLRGILDVTVAPLEEASSWVCFRVIVQEEVSRGDWLAVGAVVLRQARHDFGLWPNAGGATPSDQLRGPQSY